MLELRGVNVFYGAVQALREVSLRVDEGEIVTLIGANGAGKSTTLMAISGIVPPRRGEILFEGRPIHGLAPGRVVRGLPAAGGLTPLVPRSRRHPDAPAKPAGVQLVCPGDGDNVEPVRARRGIKAGAARLLGAAPSPTPQQHFCSSCGAEHHPAEKFCPNCGMEILPGVSDVGADRTG